MKEDTKEDTGLFNYRKGHEFLPFICSLLGFSIVAFSLFVLIYAPVKTIATYGIIIDIRSNSINPKAKIANLLILLDDGKVVDIRKPEWFNFSKNKTIILQETTSMFLGIKRYHFYNKERAYNL